MKRYNIIVVYDKDYKSVLMCLRQKDPFIGLYNFVGGKIKDDETDMQGAYRELYEETHISFQDIVLKHTHDFYYYAEDMMMQIWVGQLKKDMLVYGDENPLEWIDLEENFFNCERFAGFGNIGHILKSNDLKKDIIL